MNVDAMSDIYLNKAKLSIGSILPSGSALNFTDCIRAKITTEADTTIRINGISFLARGKEYINLYFGGEQNTFNIQLTPPASGRISFIIQQG